MKKCITILLLMALVLSLCGCSLVENVADQITAEVGLEAARKIYASLSEEDRNIFLEEISADLEMAKAEEQRWAMQSLYGNWRKELSERDGYGSVYAEKLLLSEDDTYEYGKQKGTWYVEEDGRSMCLVNGEDRIIYFTFQIFEEDGFTKLLSEEGDICYIREEDFGEVFKKKYVTMSHSMASEIFGEPVYLGAPAENVGYGPNAKLCALKSLAYDKGLVYLTGISDFSMDVDMQKKDGSIVTQNLWHPFSYIEYYEGAKVVDLRMESGLLYFVRSEYVDKIVITEDRYREVHLKDGSVYSDYVLWEMFPDLTFEEFPY